MAAWRKRSHPVVPHSFTPKVEGRWWFCPTWQLLRRNFYNFLVQSPTSVAVVGTGSLAQLPARHDHRTIVFSCLDSSNPFTHKPLMSNMAQYSLNRKVSFCNTKIERKKSDVLKKYSSSRRRETWKKFNLVPIRYLIFLPTMKRVCCWTPRPNRKKTEIKWILNLKSSWIGTKFYKFLEKNNFEKY